MELQHAPKVVTVANLVKLVRRIHPFQLHYHCVSPIHRDDNTYSGFDYMHDGCR